ncbi:gamma-glutamylcyclotransferase-like isoform X1 [Drosophila sulfurigaster albostrigata]|uniref:gamma-glutamylcyclotransferase-like isoform X1 n=2 Tax=Drosophila sulfurigaster albostrigata TaxID=89887 RepID=UPI002D21CE9E|nr:gamma-glutamylcyclotransferase-like isoform X1 [Drosophila sulfurigaster albostrigata]
MNKTRLLHKLSVVMNKFFYFGYGSNMLAARMHIQNPSARRIGVGKLKDYRLDFHGKSNTWNGAPATIVPMKGAQVLGTIWEVDQCHLESLDDQEGVSYGIYAPINVSVDSLNDKREIQCRVYHLCDQPKTDVHGLNCNEEATYCRLPSTTYLKVLVKGAKETGLPSEYIKWLTQIRHNENHVHEMETKLELAEVKLAEAISKVSCDRLTFNSVKG